MRIMRRIFLMAIAYFVCLASAIAQDTSKKLQIEEDGFQWFLLQKTNSDGRTVWGAESIDGETIIPIQNGYHLISYKKERNPFFYVTKYVTITKKKRNKLKVFILFKVKRLYLQNVGIIVFIIKIILV